MKGISLNLGSGSVPLPNFVNVDVADIPGVDVVWDLDKAPWPWEAESVYFIRAYDIFEHVNDPLTFMHECWRVLQPGRPLELHVSHWQSENAYTDPTHRRFCTPHTFDYWIPTTELHTRYGAAYAGTPPIAGFAKVLYEMDGQEMRIALRKI